MQEFVYRIENWTLIKLFGGLVIILSGLPAYLGSLLLEKLKANWKSKGDKQLEDIKGSIQKTNSTINNLTLAYLNNFQKLQEKRISSTEIIWNAVLEMKETIPPNVNIYFSILLDSEFDEKLISSQKNISNISALNENEFSNKINELSCKIEKFQPFISNNIFLLFSAYQGFIGRITYQFIKNWKLNKAKLWKEDKAIIGLLKPVMSDEEIKKLYDNQFSSFIMVLEFFETKILQELKDNLSGKSIAIDTVDYLNRLESIINAKNAE